MDKYSFRERNQELTHVRFYFKQIDMLKEALNNEQMGRLFFALAEYAQTGVEVDVGGDILFPYHMMCNSINKAMNREAL